MSRRRRAARLPEKSLAQIRRAGQSCTGIIEALKSYGIATVVGTRTWGGVISCYFNELVDGTLVTQPTSALWFDGIGLAVENHGVDPDVEVTIAPHDWAAGRDPQLDTAVRLALEALERCPPAV